MSRQNNSSLYERLRQQIVTADRTKTLVLVLTDVNMVGRVCDMIPQDACAVFITLTPDSDRRFLLQLIETITLRFRIERPGDLLVCVQVLCDDDNEVAEVSRMLGAPMICLTTQQAVVVSYDYLA